MAFYVLLCKLQFSISARIAVIPLVAKEPFDNLFVLSPSHTHFLGCNVSIHVYPSYWHNSREPFGSTGLSYMVAPLVPEFKSLLFCAFLGNNLPT